MIFYGIMAVLEVKYLHFTDILVILIDPFVLWLEINVVVYDEVEEKL